MAWSVILYICCYNPFHQFFLNTRWLTQLSFFQFKFSHPHNQDQHNQADQQMGNSYLHDLNMGFCLCPFSTCKAISKGV